MRIVWGGDLGGWSLEVILSRTLDMFAFLVVKVEG